MLSSDLTIYAQEILNFLKTVTIKYSLLNTPINSSVIQKGYSVNLDEPATWKYNLNAIGEYHESDTQMQVISLDTREVIVFNKQNLAVHPRTASAYAPGSDYFDTLCANYPDQTDLIKSILFPYPDMEDWLELSDITLAQYGSGYLETWEEPELISRLKKFLSVVAERWHFSFLEVEPYFVPTFYGQLYTQMAAFLLVSRDSLIRTPYVHSWHIWQYLTSNGLDDYSDVLTRKKSMFLYQNWDYLKQNMGKQSNLKILVENLLSDLNLGIFGRKVIQQSHTGQDVYQLTPQLGATIVSEDNIRDNAITDESIGDMQTRLYEANFIPALTDNITTTVTRTLGDTTLNEWFTKYLELRPTTADSRYRDILDRFILDNLVQSCVSGYYSATDTITDPLSGSKETMTVADRLLLFTYCSAKSVGVTPVTLPTEYISSYSLREKPLDPGTTYPWQGHMRLISSYIDAQSFMTSVGYNISMNSATSFSSNLSELWSTFVTQLGSCEITDDTFLYDLKMYLLWCRYKHYEVIPLSLAANVTTFTQWFDTYYPTLGVLFSDTYETSANPQSAYSDLADAVIASLVPSTSELEYYGNYTVSDSGYKRLRDLFVQLCSYNVNFIDYANTNSEYLILGKFTLAQLGEVISETVTSTNYLKDLGASTATYREPFVVNATKVFNDGNTTGSDIDTTTSNFELIDQSDNNLDNDTFNMRWYATHEQSPMIDSGMMTMSYGLSTTSFVTDDN